MQGSGKCVVGLLGVSLPGGGCELRAQAETRAGRGVYVANGRGAPGISTGLVFGWWVQDMCTKLVCPALQCDIW